MDQSQFVDYLNNRYGFIDLIEYLPSKTDLGFHYFVGVDTSQWKHVFIKKDGILGQSSEREAMMIQLLTSRTQSEYFPKLVAYEETGPYPFVATELIQGITLEQLLVQEQSLSLGQKWELMRQMIDILTILQNARVIHRDIRPGNMLIQMDPAGQPIKLFLIDFAFSVGLWPNNLPELPYLSTHDQMLVDLGGVNYKPGILRWDDAYSFCQTALMVDSNCEKLFPELWNRLYSSTNKIFYAYQ